MLAATLATTATAPTMANAATAATMDGTLTKTRCSGENLRSPPPEGVGRSAAFLRKSPKPLRELP